ncbi:MAG: class I SAM-dependent methyltransferase [Pyrinomonadaceae bacterium]
MTSKTDNYFGKANAVTSGDLVPDEVVDCPLCGREPQPFAVDYQGFRLCECPSCGLQFVTPRLSFDALSEKVYSENYLPGRDADNDLSTETVHYYTCQLSSFERLLGRKGRVLDIGCANGSFLDFAREKGWEIAGSDIKLSADARALNCPLREGRIQELDYGDEQFDLIRLNHVLEHTQAPVEDLERCREMLAPSGILFISVPNIAGLSPRLKSLQSKLHLKSHRWRHYAAMHHLFFFSPETLRATVEKAGMKVLEWETPVPKKSKQNVLLENVYRSILERTRTASILDCYCTAVQGNLKN